MDQRVEIVTCFGNFELPKDALHNLECPRYRVNPRQGKGRWPAFVNGEGARVWTEKDGWIHRDHGPAIELLSGGKIWFHQGFVQSDNWLTEETPMPETPETINENP